MELTSDNVKKIMEDCLYEDNEIQGYNGVTVEGIVNNYVFHKERLESHREEIISMIEQLDDTFLLEKGGGWTFLNLCMRKDGIQWTGLHWTQEQLVCLAAGLDLAAWVPRQREFWRMLPGGVPYVVFSATPIHESSGS